MKFSPLYLIMQVWKLASNLFPTRGNRAGAAANRLPKKIIK